MKSPLLLSSNLGALNPEIIAIVNNTEVRLATGASHARWGETLDGTHKAMHEPA